MKNKSIIKVITFFVLICQFYWLSACSNIINKYPETSNEVLNSSMTETSSDNKGIFSLLKENGSPAYKIVRPENAGAKLVSAVTNFRKSISEATEQNFLISSDWVKNTAEIDNESYEILIGQTNREASVSLSADMSLGDYTIKVSGNKIVICGGSEAATISALTYFRDNCLKLADGSAEVIIDSAIEYKKEYLGKDFSISGVQISEYCIVYSATAEDEEGITIANQLNNFIADMCGITLDIKKDTKTETNNEIILGKTNRTASEVVKSMTLGTYDYIIHVKGNKMLIDGGSSFAIFYGIKLLKENYIAKNIGVADQTSETGSMYGQYLYEREVDAEVRVMSNNVWDCDNNVAAWAAVGEDCSARVRSVGLAAVYMAYLPDVICFQEMSIVMITRIKNELSKCGYDYSLLSFTAGSDADNTCLLYRTDTVELKNKGRHEYTYGNNGGSKSYTWGYFILKASGDDFVALSTHMWYKSEVDQAGSNKWRADQASEIVARTKSLVEQYNCPVFAMGDFNTTTATDAFRVFIDGGFLNTYNIATVYADNHRGRHSCNASGFARETSPGTYEGDAIDHILLLNGKNTEILTFNHVRPYFYIKLSDHYPVYVDAVLS